MSERRYLIFEISGENHALLLEHVAEIMDPATWYPIPRVPRYYRGVMNCHGRPTPVLDLALLFRGKPVAAAGKVLVLAGKTANLALLVDDVINIVSGHFTVEPATGGVYGIGASILIGGVAVKIIEPEKLIEVLEAEINGPAAAVRNNF